MEVNTALLSQDLDPQFDAIHTLSWYPWVGKDYFSARHKILIVAESHYNWGDNADELNRKVLNHKYNTRNVVQYFPVSHSEDNKMFENLHRLCFPENG